ncbi:MAG: type II secretion system protein GspC [Mariprofundales bacterium]
MVAAIAQPQWWLQRVPMALEMVLVVALAWLVAGLLLPVGNDAGLSLDAMPEMVQKQENRQVDLQAILDQHLFGKPLAKPKVLPKAKPVAPPPPVTKVPINLNAKLVGTVMAGDHSLAMILPMPGKPVDIYYIGDAIIPRVSLRKVFADHVLLDADGDSRELWLDKKAQAAAQGNAPPPPVVQSLPSSAPNRRNMGLSRQVVNNAMANFSTLLSQARILPHFTNGKADGFLVTDIAAGSLYQSLGLQNGDILSGVNGKPVTSMEQAMNMYRQLQKAPSVDVSVMRGGQAVTFHYNIR